MKKWIVGIIAIFVLTYAVRTYAAMQINSINVNFKNHSASMNLQEGDFQTSNYVSTNGDTIQTNKFVAEGETTSETIGDPAFSEIFGGLIQQQAINMDAVTNATIGQVGVSLAGFDTTNTDLNSAN